MKFNQNKEDGSCDLEFNEEEINILLRGYCLDVIYY